MPTRYWKPYQIGPLTAVNLDGVVYNFFGHQSFKRVNISPPKLNMMSWEWAAWSDILIGGTIGAFLRYKLDLQNLFPNASEIILQKVTLWSQIDYYGQVWNEDSFKSGPSNNIDDPRNIILTPSPSPGTEWAEQQIGSDIEEIADLTGLSEYYLFFWARVAAGQLPPISWITHHKSAPIIHLKVLDSIKLTVKAIDQYSNSLNDFVLQVYEDDRTTRVPDISDIPAINGIAEVQLESGMYYVKGVKGTDESNLVLADCENDLSLTIVLPIGVPSTEKVSFSAKVTSQGNMVSAALVTLKPLVFSEKTDLQGETPTVSGILKGTYTLECVKDGYEMYSTQVTLLNDTSLYPIELIPITVPPPINFLPIAIGIAIGGSILAIGTGYYIYKTKKKKKKPI